MGKTILEVGKKRIIHDHVVMKTIATQVWRWIQNVGKNNHPPKNSLNKNAGATSLHQDYKKGSI